MKIKLTRKGEIVRDILVGIGLVFLMLFITGYDSIFDNLFGL